MDYGFDASGKSIRHTCESAAKADEAIDAHKQEVKKKDGVLGFLRPLERGVIVTTLRDIKSQGLTVQGVWAEHQRWRKDNPQSITTPMPDENVVNPTRPHSWWPVPVTVTGYAPRSHPADHRAPVTWFFRLHEAGRGGKQKGCQDE